MLLCLQFLQVLRQVDSVLFSLLILQGISDSQGRIWRCHPAHLYAIEATVLKVKNNNLTNLMFQYLNRIMRNMLSKLYHC